MLCIQVSGEQGTWIDRMGRMRKEAESEHERAREAQVFGLISAVSETVESRIDRSHVRHAELSCSDVRACCRGTISACEANASSTPRFAFWPACYISPCPSSCLSPCLTSCLTSGLSSCTSCLSMFPLFSCVETTVETMDEQDRQGEGRGRGMEGRQNAHGPRRCMPRAV